MASSILSWGWLAQRVWGCCAQCADYFPERVGDSVAAAGWSVACTAVREVDADVCRRDLTLTPPPGQVCSGCHASPAFTLAHGLHGLGADC
jgi:hypothetical protein